MLTFEIPHTTVGGHGEVYDVAPLQHTGPTRWRRRKLL